MTEPVTVGDATLYTGDCLEVLARLPAESVHCCITSPPSFLEEARQPIQAAALHPKTIQRRKICLRKGQVGKSDNLASPMSKRASSRFSGAMFVPRCLQCAEAQDDIALSCLYPKKRTKFFENTFGRAVACLITKEWPSVIAMGPLFVIPTSQLFSQKADSTFVNHAHLNAGIIRRAFAALASVGFAALDSNPALPIYNAREISQVGLFRHGFLLLGSMLLYERDRGKAKEKHGRSRGNLVL